MRRGIFSLLCFCALVFPGVSFSQAIINENSLEGFDEAAALLELRENNITEEMISGFLAQKKLEYISKKNGTWHSPAPLLSLLKKNNHSTLAAGCDNVDFETGDFTGWSRSYGVHPTYSPVASRCIPAANPICPFAGFVPGSHTIMTGVGFDPNVGPAMPVVAPGGSYSVRIGNLTWGGDAAQLSTTFTVNQSHFSYQYAVVLNDIGHPAVDQPFFKIDVIETATGTPVNCAQYFVVAAGGIPGFRTSGSGNKLIRWKPWSTVTMDLNAYMGQQITIRFTAADCGQGGHFGYAYIDCFCEDLKVIQQDTVCEGDNANLVAPDNFASYNWAPVNSTSQTLVTNIPTTHTVTMTSFSGCITKSYHTLLTFPEPHADFSYMSTIDEYTIEFHDLSTISPPGTIIGWEWQFGDGNMSNVQHPTNVYAEGGTYTVTLTVTSMDGCSASITQEVNVGSYTFYTPSAFTPNNDGVNDDFEPKGKGISEYRLLIFDRWGMKIFETTDMNQTWNGKIKDSNKLCPQDVYVWKVYLKDLFENEYETNGHVALIR